MRNFKRFLALMLTVLMVAGCFAIPTSAAASDKFDDVDQYVDAIDTLAAIGVVTGKSETTFGTDEAVQRYQAALLFARALTGKTDNAVWQTGVNNSVFADLDENPQDLFVNAISYANNNGIVTGKSATKFAPRDGITLEQGLTMAVRALGYETAAMKASATTGLWMYIDKAISLGLDAGLEDITDYKATLTRGQMAQLIYNMIFVETADGYTYAAKAFNLITETFVLTSTNTTKYDIGNDGITLAAPGYVGLTVLAEDGSLGKTYYFEAETLKALLGAESADFSGVVGYSYNVIADDTLSTIYAIDQNTVKVFENTLDATAFTISAAANGNGALTVDGQAYTVVSKYTGKLWNKNVKNTANAEVLFYDWTYAKTATEGAYYYYDVNGNIVSKDGKILMYLVANGGVATGFAAGKTYMVKDETTGTYRLPTATDWANATYYQTTATGSNYYDQVNANSAFVGNSKYQNLLFGEIKAIDDDADGKYDRMFFTKYQFGQYTTATQTNGHVWASITGANGEQYIVNNNNTTAPITFKGKAVAHGNWIVFAWNDALNELIVKDVIGSQVGYVNGFSVTSSTITIDGTAYAIKNLALEGIASVATIVGANNVENWAAATDDLIGRYVTYYKIGNTVVVLGNANTSKYVVFDGIISVAADNAISVKAYVESNSASVINVVSLNGYPLSTFALNGYNSTLNYVYSTLLAMARGTILTAAVDANGNYHLYDAKKLAATDVYSVATTTANQRTDADTITATPTLIGGKRVMAVNGVDSFYVDANTTWVFAEADGVKGTYKGIPAANSSITGADMVVVKIANSYASFVYALGATLNGTFQNTQYNTIVYIDQAQTSLTNSFADQFTGTLWTYARAVDLRTGAYTDVKAASARLIAGNFYYVKDGFAIAEYTPVAEKIESIGTNYIAGLMSGAVVSDSVTTAAPLNAVIAMNPAGVVTSNNAIVNYYTAANITALGTATDDVYALGYVVPITVDGVQKYTVVFTTVSGAIQTGSHETDWVNAVKALITVGDPTSGTVTIEWADDYGTTLSTANRVSFTGTNLHNTFNYKNTSVDVNVNIAGSYQCGQNGGSYTFTRSNGGEAASVTIVIDGVEIMTIAF